MVGEEPERLARLTRYLQAEKVRMAAQNAREQGVAFQAEKLMENEFAYASCALVEADGLRRPAFWALRSVWQKMHAFVRASHGAPGEKVSLPVVLLRDSALGKVKVRCCAYDMQGKLLADEQIDQPEDGNFAFVLPEEECAVLVRTTVEDAYGRIANQCDQLVCASAGGYPLAPLWNPPRARLSMRAGVLTNEGPSAALAVGAQNYYGALLPGESINAEGAFECLNAIL